MHGTGPSSHSGPPKNIVAYKAALKNKRQIAEGTWAFVFERPEGFQFKAGQHIRITLLNPTETDSEGNSRFLSLASTPQEKDLVIAMRMRDTAFKRVLRNLQIGDKVKMEMRLDSPHGSFALHDDVSKPAVFLIGGIGIVPAFSMIKDALERKLPHKIFLFYSNRRPEDAPFLDELEQLAKQHPSFTLIATMTEPEKSAQDWQGETGFINISMVTKYVTNIQSPIYYLAGLPEMTSAMKTMLLYSRINDDSIRAEEFTGFNLNEINKDTSYPWKKHILIALVALAIIAVAVAHAGAAVSISKTPFGTLSFKNPLLYVMIGLMLVLLKFKLKHISGLMRRKGK